MRGSTHPHSGEGTGPDGPSFHQGRDPNKTVGSPPLGWSGVRLLRPQSSYLGAASLQGEEPDSTTAHHQTAAYVRWEPRDVSHLNLVEEND